MKKNIGFSIFQFIINGNTFSINDFSLPIPEGIEKEEIGGDIVSVRKIDKNIIENRFITFYFEGGDKFPYSETVIDVDSNEEKENPRDSNLVELDDQLFILFDIKTQRLYLSDQRQKLFISNWFKNWLGKNVCIKALIDKGEFLNKLNEIGEISFSAEPNLLLKSDVLGSHLLEDIYGYGATDIKVILDYKNGKKFKGNDFIDKIKNLITNKDLLKNLTIIGKTDEKLESILNMNEVVNKIILTLEPNLITKKFDVENVFYNLISNIK